MSEVITGWQCVRLKFIVVPDEKDDAIDPTARIIHALLSLDTRLQDRLRELERDVKRLEVEKERLIQMLKDRGER